MNKRGISKLRIFLIIIMAVIVIVALYFTFFFHYTCNSLACFQAHQKNCDKTKFINDVEDVTFEYTIKGRSKGDCVVNVKLLSVKKGNIDITKLEGKSMNCYIPKESLISPESDMTKCHGELREEMQETIINKLHAYIIENVGDIREELKKLI